MKEVLLPPLVGPGRFIWGRGQRTSRAQLDSRDVGAGERCRDNLV